MEEEQFLCGESAQAGSAPARPQSPCSPSQDASRGVRQSERRRWLSSWKPATFELDEAVHLYLETLLISAGATVKLPGVVMGYEVLGDSDVTGALPNAVGSHLSAFSFTSQHCAREYSEINPICSSDCKSYNALF